MRRNRNKRRIYQAPNNMIHNPTVVTTDGPNGSQNLSGSSPYFTITVDTTDAGLADKTKIVLFDSSQGYQLLTPYVMPLGVVISSDSEAQFLLNDLAHVAAVISTIKMELAGDATKFSQQFSGRIDLYETKRGMPPSVVKSLRPSMGISEAQFRSDLTHFFADITVTNRHALVYEQHKGVVTTFGFFQDAEVGRKL